MINIASIGLGGRGSLAKLAHRPEQGSRLVAACDVDRAPLDQARTQYGDDFFVTDDYRALLARPGLDAVFVTSPDDLHEEHALAAIEAGLAVYLEKPMAITIEGCDKILRAARRRGTPLFVGHNLRFSPVIEKMKALVDAGRIGQVQAIWCRHFIGYGGDAYYKDWHADRRRTTGLLLQKGAHDIDIIHYLAGGYTRRTTGFGKLSVYNQVADRVAPGEPAKAQFSAGTWPPLSQTRLNAVIDVEDHSMMLMELDNGVQASYQQCHYAPDCVRNYTVLGTEGRIENFGDHSTPDHWARVAVWDRRCGYIDEGTESFAIPPLEGSHGGADPRIVENFLRVLRGEPYQGASPIDARMSVAAGVMATESLRSGGVPRDVPPPPAADEDQPA